MVDLAEIGIGVDTREIQSAKGHLRDLGSAFNSAERSASVFTQAFDKATRQAAKDIDYMRKSAQAFRDLVNQANNVTNAYKSAEDSAAVFTRELRNQEAQAQKTAKANQEAINALLGVGGKSAMSGGAGFSAMAAEAEKLRLKYDGLYASSKFYQDSLDELNRAHNLGAISSAKLAMETDRLNDEFQQFQNGTANLSNRFVQYDAALVQSSKSTNRFGMYAQQVGYQVGDFFVQVQSGTNAFVAFGQQATQLAGLLPGLAGAILGIGISVGTMFLSMWSRTKEAREGVVDLDKTFNELTSTVAAVKSSMDAAVASTSDLTREFGNSVSVVRELQVALLDLEILKAQTALNQTFDTINAGFSSLVENVNTFNLATSSASGGLFGDYLIVAQESIRKINDEFGLTIIEATKVADAVKLIGDASSPDNMVQGARQLVQVLSAVRDESGRIPPNIADIATKAAQAAVESLRLKGYMDEAETIASTFSGLDLDSGVEAAADAAARLAKNLDLSLQNAKEIIRLSEEQGAAVMSPAGPAGLGPLADQLGAPYFGPPGSAPTTSPRPLAAPTGIDFGVPGVAGRGGGGGSDQYASNLQSLLESLQTEQEVVDAWYESSKTILEDRRATEILGEQSHKEALLRLEEEFQKRKAEIQSATEDQQLADMGDFFGAMASVAQSGGGKLVKIASVFSAAQGLINSYLAYTEVLKDPAYVGRPWARFAGAAAVLASGLKMVQAIKGVGSGGGGPVSGGGVGSVGNTGGTAAAPATPQTVLIQGISPTDMISGEQLSELFDNLYKENNNRGMVFMVAR